ncbi:MAG: Nif3-like dinuclear metal center hexameric protein [Gammaproteobacteria bacterium]|nr:Nif3-like dinuclear metal center hexameric protein [Gammaproteobacteria bacterium]MBU1655267.1 Nif3-like dinuclear metal center hexameric protein [Gammaproteobacteria bacterium]MBU1962046.1 Nif3-like dinuclear metal center hexameric protein [Gammaproteobacteria bacterium]
MADLSEIETYCNSLLNADRFRDYCPNGLQVDGGRVEVKHLATAVTASLAVIEAAAAWGADLLLVHHGYFWKGEPERLTGVKGRRIRALMQNGLSLMAYHLPLDVHPELGNNRGLGEALGLRGEPVDEEGLLWSAALPKPMGGEAVAGLIERALGRPPLHLTACRNIERLFWCSGAAQGQMERVAERGGHAYLSGEVSEQSYHLAQELDLHYFACGHHATERFGVRSLGSHLAGRFGVEHRFIDQDNPV